jgi:hypothetical protein
MINELFNLYKSRLTFKGLVVSKNGIFANSIYFILLILCTLWLLLHITNTYFLLYLPLSLIPVIFGQLINSRTIKKKYPEFWISYWKHAHTGFHNLYLTTLENYLIKVFDVSHFSEIEDIKLDKIQNEIKERANQEKAPYIIVASTFIGLFIPLWSAYVVEILDIFSGSVDLLSQIFGMILIAILSIAIIAPAIKSIRDITITKFHQWTRLNNLITELRSRQQIPQLVPVEDYKKELILN